MLTRPQVTRPGSPRPRSKPLSSVQGKAKAKDKAWTPKAKAKATQLCSRSGQAKAKAWIPKAKAKDIPRQG